MPSDTLNLVNSFVEDIAEMAMNLQTHSLKYALSNTVPTVAQTVFSPGDDHLPPAAANGYAPTEATLVSSGQTDGTYTLVVDDTVFTAAAGDIGPFRYAILYDDDATDKLIGWIDYGESLTIHDTETFTVNGATVITIAPPA